MTLNDGIEVLIHYDAEDFPVAWYRGRPKIWPSNPG